MSTRYFLSLVLLTFALMTIGCGDNEESRTNELKNRIELVPHPEKHRPDTAVGIIADTTEMELLDTAEAEDSSDVVEVEEQQSIIEQELAWNIKEATSDASGSVSIAMSGHEYIVIPEVKGEYFIIEKSDFEESEIPSSGEIAMMSIDDNGGAVLYAEVSGTEVVIYRKELNDMSEGERGFKEFKRITP